MLKKVNAYFMPYFNPLVHRYFAMKLDDALHAVVLSVLRAQK